MSLQTQRTQDDGLPLPRAQKGRCSMPFFDSTRCKVLRDRDALASLNMVPCALRALSGRLRNRSTSAGAHACLANEEDVFLFRPGERNRPLLTKSMRATIRSERPRRRSGRNAVRSVDTIRRRPDDVCSLPPRNRCALFNHIASHCDD